MFGKSKNKKSEKVRIDTLVADTAYALDDFMSSGQSSAELLAKLQLSRKQVFEAVNFDDEVESCKEDLRTAMTTAGISSSTAVSMTVDSSGKLTAASSTDSASKAAIQAVLDNSKLGSTLNTGMSSLAVSSDAKFTLKSNDNGSVTVESSDAATKAAVQKFFDNNPALVKKFGQIQALSGLDDARKSLQVSPSDLRKRIEVESMAAWWAGSGSTSSSFGNYSDGSLSMLSGLNLSV